MSNVKQILSVNISDHLSSIKVKNSESGRFFFLLISVLYNCKLILKVLESCSKKTKRHLGLSELLKGIFTTV